MKKPFDYITLAQRVAAIGVVLVVLYFLHFIWIPIAALAGCIAGVCGVLYLLAWTVTVFEEWLN